MPVEAPDSCMSGCPSATLTAKETIPFQDWKTLLTEPGQELKRTLVRTVLPIVDRLPAPLLRAAFPSLCSVLT